MGCERFEKALWEAAEGEPSAALAAHLGKCPACRQALQSLQDMQTGFAVLRTVNAPEARAAVRARLRTWPTRSIFVPALVGATTFCAIAGLLLVHAIRGRPPAAKPPPAVTQAPPPLPAPALGQAARESPRVIHQEMRQAREERRRAVRKVASRPRRTVRAGGPRRASRLARAGPPTPALQVNPASEISDASVTPVIMDPAHTRPSRHYTVMVPGRTDPIKQYPVMIPGRTDPVRRYTAVGPRRYGPRQEPQVVLDPTYRRLPQREVIVLSDGEQMPLSMETGEY